MRTNLQESRRCGTFSPAANPNKPHRTSDEALPMTKKLTLHLLNEAFTINKLPQFAEIPSILSKGEMCFILRTDDELTIVCPDYMAPNNVQQELGWRCLRVGGDINLQEVGVLASITGPLAEANIPLFAVSTFNTDYVFVMGKSSS